METYKCIQDYPLVGLPPFKKGNSYLFDKFEYCSLRFKEVEYRYEKFLDESVPKAGWYSAGKGFTAIRTFAITIPEEKFKKHFVDLRKKRDFILVKILDL